jgi:uncharacterized delta-60 repeat protein
MVFMHAQSPHGRTAASVSVRSKKTLNKALGAVIEPLEQRTLLSAGAPVGSAVFTDFGPELGPSTTEVGGLVYALSDGKYLQVGMSGSDFALARYQTDELGELELDATFGTGGKSVVALPGSSILTAVNAVAVYPEDALTPGRIILVGTASTAGSPDFLVAAFKPDGSIETSFGTGGVVVTEFDVDTPRLQEARAVAIQEDGKIVVAGGDTSSGSSQGFAVARYTASGSPDNSFSSDGLIEGDYFGFNFEDRANAVAIDGDGNIILAGTTRDFIEQGPRVALRKYSDTGAPLDSKREDFLSATVVFGDNIYAMAVDKDNNIVLAGNSDSPEMFLFGQNFLLLRYDANLELDGSFGDGGVVKTGFSPAPTWLVAAATDLAIESDGNIIVGGSVISCNTVDCDDVMTTSIVVGRYVVDGTNDGDLDTSFNGSGLVLYPTAEIPVGTIPVSITIQNDTTNDNQMVAFGSFVSNGLSLQDFILARYDLNVAAAGAGGGGDSVTIGGDSSTNEGGTVNVSGTVTSGGGGSGTAWLQYRHAASTSTGGGTITSVTIDWDDGSPLQIVPVVAGSYSANHQYVDDNPSGTMSDIYTITVAAGAASDTHNVTVSNVAPNGSIASPTSGVRGFAQSYSSNVTDPGTQDTFTYAWTAKLGLITVASGSSANFTFIPADTGIYTISLTVTDDDNGSDTDSKSLTVTATSLSGGVLQIGGDGANDNISVKNSMGSIVVTDNGANTTYNGLNTIMIAGGDGNDDIRINPNVTQSVIVFGGAGNDSIKGGANADILVGGDGDDLLHGQDGRDLLIGSKGADRIIGHADDDILVAGYTNYDLDIAALQAILSEWTSTRTYQQRVDNVMGNTTGGNNGSYILKPYDSQTNNADATAFDDGDVDILTGNSGQDLFMFNSDLAGQDSITDLSAAEFAPDLDWILNP